VRLDGSEMDLLVQWIERREAVRRAKAAGQPWPWTQDPPLQQWRWCNVRRMDDRVSLALLRRWYAPSATDAATALVSACLARLVNWPDLLMAITAGETFALRHLERARERLQARAEDGEKVFTGAYVVPGRPGEGKVLTVVNHARNVRDGAAKLWGSSMRQTWANLTRLDGLGSFLAGQMDGRAHLGAAGAGQRARDQSRLRQAQGQGGQPGAVRAGVAFPHWHAAPPDRGDLGRSRPDRDGRAELPVRVRQVPAPDAGRGLGARAL
jgi:hypothetical protein